MQLTDKIYVAGHNGMVGGDICRQLTALGYTNLIKKSSAELDLRSQSAVNVFFEQEKPDYVFLAAAKVGGILANNTYKADFIYDNLMIEANIIHAAYNNNVTKLLFLGSSCIYPKMASQPLTEDALLTGLLEPTNEPYAIAKIAGIKMCDAYRDQYGCNFISVMPTNLFGIGDNYHPQNAHVLPALIRRFHEAKINNTDIVTIWGTGAPLREFLFSEDLAEACVFLMETYNEPGLINIGTGKDISIKDLAILIKEITGYNGTIEFDTTKPDGTPRKLMNVNKLSELGWQYKTELKEGIVMAYNDFLNNSSK